MDENMFAEFVMGLKKITNLKIIKPVIQSAPFVHQ